MSGRGELLRLPQESETAVRLKPARWLSLRYAYARSADTIAANETGQDYLSYGITETFCVFALCDGVSQSFFGNIAARLLGDALIAFLGGSVAANVDAAALTDQLRGQLQALTRPASERVLAYPLSDTLPPMLRDVLAQKRALGSESTFVCGRVDKPGPQFPGGRFIFAWMGDSRLRFWGPGGERSAELGALGDTFRTEERWSTRQGIVGEGPRVCMGALEEGRAVLVTRIALYSDGLAALDGLDGVISNFALADLIERAGLSAQSDDVSLLEIWSGGPPRAAEAKPLPAPAQVTLQPAAAGGALLWRAVSGAASYEIETRGHLVQTWPAPLTPTAWLPPAELPLDTQFRVRARVGDEPGRWSASVRAAPPRQSPERDKRAKAGRLTALPPRPASLAAQDDAATSPPSGSASRAAIAAATRPVLLTRALPSPPAVRRADRQQSLRLALLAVGALVAGVAIGVGAAMGGRAIVDHLPGNAASAVANPAIVPTALAATVCPTAPPSVKSTGNHHNAPATLQPC